MADQPDVQVKPGLRFIHSRFLDDQMQPLVCRVTKVAQGTVYWRGDTGGSCYKVPLQVFLRASVKTVL